MYGTISIVLLLLGIAAIAYGFMARKKATLIINTPTTRTDRIKRPGFYEVEGIVTASNPIHIEGWGMNCVWYKFCVEEKVEHQDSDGYRQTRWRTIDSRSDMCPFQVKDKGGTINVIPNGAEIEGKRQTYDGQKTPGFLETMFSNRRTLGTRTTIDYLPVDSHVYVLGKVDTNQGQLSFQQGGDAFIISDKTETEILGARETTFYMACAGGGVALLSSFISFLMYMR